MIDLESEEWYHLTPAQRFVESMRLWETFLLLGGTCEPEPDSQSPFYFEETSRPRSPHGRPGVHPVRRRRTRTRGAALNGPPAGART
jgi:hypothetical protein